MSTSPPPAPGCCGESLEPLSCPQGIIARDRSTYRFIDTIRINRITRQQDEGRTYWIKQRRLSSRFIIPCANTFFRIAGNPVVVWAKPSDWQQWEVDSYLLLHGREGYHAESLDPRTPRTLRTEELPGFALELPAKKGSITPRMLAAAARELRRAHRLSCPALGGEGWSHGDAHLDNFIYDPTDNRARLIDFEVAHEPGMPELDRHADDLLVMVQSTMGYWPLKRWLEHSRVVIQAYLEETSAQDRAALVQRLRERLILPTGISRIWWSIRTDYLPAANRTACIEALRSTLDLSGPSDPSA